VIDKRARCERHWGGGYIVDMHGTEAVSERSERRSTHRNMPALWV